jgi:hypothetical protein
VLAMKMSSQVRHPERFTGPNDCAFSRPLCVRWFTGIAVAIWGLAVIAGTGLSLQYESTPGKTQVALGTWPSDTQCTLSTDVPTLLMFVHPQCVCSRASLHELSLIVAHCPERANVQVVVLQPSSMPLEWSQSELWQTAQQIPKVILRPDQDGIEHRKFNASVSGEVFLYRPGGELAFHGGITASRGHIGDNPGRTQIESILRQQTSNSRSTPVFGCDLESPGKPLQKSCAACMKKATNQ